MLTTTIRSQPHEMTAWEAAGRPVMGHACRGMRMFQSGARDVLTPGLTPEGFVAASDSNPMPIKFCPWCATELEPADLVT